MNINEIKAIFLAAYNNKILMKPACAVPERPLPNNYEHRVYSYAALPELIKQLKKLPVDRSDERLDQLNRFAVRYVVEDSGKIWFAQEGETGRNVPAHTQMRNRCCAAGSIFFSPDYESIISITNISGHFKPKPETLIWAIAALLSLKVSFAPMVTLQFQTENPETNAMTRDELSIDSQHLSTLLPPGFYPESNLNYEIELHSVHDIIHLFSPPPSESSPVRAVNSFEKEQNIDDSPIKRLRYSDASDAIFFRAVSPVKSTCSVRFNYSTPPRTP